MKDEWKRRQVAELITEGKLFIGDGYRAKNEELATSGLPFARAGNIDGGFRFQDADHFPEQNLPRVGNKVSQPGDVVFTSKGTVGRFAFVRKDTPRFVYSPQLCFWRSLRPQSVHSRFLFYWMFSREFFLQYKAVAGQTDMAEYVSLTDQRRMHITLPSPGQQRAIAHILGTLDDKIDLNRRMNETLEAIARALFKSWFVDFDLVRAKAEGRQPAGMDAETAVLFPDASEGSPLGVIPQGWMIGTLGDVADNPRRVVNPMSISPETAYIGLEHMPQHSIALSEWTSTRGISSGKFRFQCGEILFGKLRPYFHKVGVAATEGVCSTDILVVVPRLPQWFGLVLGHVSSDDLVQYADATSTGTKMPRTSWRDIAQYKIALPPLRIAEVFNAKIKPMVELIRTNILQSHTLASVRDTLLPRLLSGEIRVAEAEKLTSQVT